MTPDLPGGSREGRRSGSLMVMLLVLYMAQTVPMQFYYIGFPAVFRDSGASLEQIGWIGIVFLPWAFKFLWAPIMDRRRGAGRQAYTRGIVIFQVMTAVLLLAAAFFPVSGGIVPVLVIATMVATACATQDIAVDGWAISRLRRDDLGWGNAMQGTGGAVGGFIGGAMMLPLYGWMGWSGLHILLAAFFLIVTLLVLFLGRRVPPGHPLTAEPPSFKRLFSRPGFTALIVVILLTRLPQGFILPLLQSVMTDAGTGFSELGFLGGGGAMVSGLAGAVLAGMSISRYGLRTTFLICIPGIVLTIAFFAAVLALHLPYHFLVAGYLAIWFANATFMVVLYTLFMRFADIEQGSTDFTFLVCVDAFAIMCSGITGGFLADAYGYPAVFAGSGFLLLMMWLPAGKLLSPSVRNDPSANFPVPLSCQRRNS